MTSGIYCIENIIDGKKYVGQSVNVDKRIREHYRNWNKNTFEETSGENRHLWFAVKKHGEDNFIFTVIEFCPKEELDNREEFYIEYLKSHESQHGYNVLFGGFNRTGTHHTEETKEKLSLANTGRKVSEYVKELISIANKGKVFSEEHKENISKGRKGKLMGKDNPAYGKKYFLGKKHTEETKRKQSLVKMGKPRDEKTKEKLRQIKGEKHWAWGKKFPEEHCNNISYSTVGKKHGKGSSQYLGVSFYSKLKKWKVSITINKKQIYLGVFENELDAARAYDKCSWDEYHDFEKLNFPNEYEGKQNE